MNTIGDLIAAEIDRSRDARAMIGGRLKIGDLMTDVDRTAMIGSRLTIADDQTMSDDPMTTEDSQMIDDKPMIVSEPTRKKVKVTTEGLRAERTTTIISTTSEKIVRPNRRSDHWPKNRLSMISR